ncbi:MAG: hypothetical protein ACTSY1_07640 [Alphaproteobacteria bacterium]
MFRKHFFQSVVAARHSILTGVAAIVLVASVGTSLAQTRTFNYPKINGYAVDRCFNWGLVGCNQGSADAYCRRMGYTSATRFKWDWMAPTFVQGAGNLCTKSGVGGCGGFVFVTCTRGAQHSTNAACDKYARTAIAQHRDNLRRRCGGTGGRWQSNYNNHYNWCVRVNANARQSETNARANRLRRCGATVRPGPGPGSWSGKIVARIERKHKCIYRSGGWASKRDNYLCKVTFSLLNTSSKSIFMTTGVAQGQNEVGSGTWRQGIGYPYDLKPGKKMILGSTCIIPHGRSTGSLSLGGSGRHRGNSNKHQFKWRLTVRCP